MTPDREDQIERLCHEALALDEADRAAFLASACGGDESLLREVSSLLPHDEAAGWFLQVPALDVLAQTPASHEVATAAMRESSAASTLAPGTRFGLYEVLSVIGSGGMGEVYRARDTRLQRDVALKVLPDRFSRNTERLARFEREAHVLASLSHPNIATIHGIEHIGGISALVLEVVEGQTLAERLRRGPLPIDASLEIAHQIAEALEAAHERGIVHRDLKPANVMVTPENRVKLLDFGVAKVFDSPIEGSTLTSNSNGAIRETQPGLVPGTAAYMSPEQARGEVIDRRSDIWAFGCVLFEMLTGRSPFQGRTVAESLTKVLDGRPEFEALPKATPSRDAAAAPAVPRAFSQATVAAHRRRSRRHRRHPLAPRRTPERTAFSGVIIPAPPPAGHGWSWGARSRGPDSLACGVAFDLPGRRSSRALQRDTDR